MVVFYKKGNDMSIDKITPEDYMSDAEWDKQIDSLASNQQVGGDHYKDLAISPVDYIYANSLSWSIGNVIKLVTRKKFDPVEDLLKAKHYIDLELEKSIHAIPMVNHWEKQRKN